MEENVVGIPEDRIGGFELYRGTQDAKLNSACVIGHKIGYSPLLGRQKDGQLHPHSIIIWHNQYQKLTDDLAALPPNAPTLAEPLLEIKNFADYFVQERSNGQNLSAMVMGMYNMKMTNPLDFQQDGKYVPYKPPQKKPCAKAKVCSACADLRQQHQRLNQNNRSIIVQYNTSDNKRRNMDNIQ